MKEELVLFDRLFKEKPIQEWSSNEIQAAYFLTKEMTEHLLSQNSGYFLEHLQALYPNVEDLHTYDGPLIEALCKIKSYDLIKEILKRWSVNVHYEYSFGTVIDEIIRINNVPLFLNLIAQESFDLDFINQEGYSVLHQLVRYNQPFLLRSVLAKASLSQIMLTTLENLTLCDVAIKFFNNKIMHFLLDMFPQFAEPLQEAGSMTLLHYSVIYQNTEATRFLLQRYPDLLMIENGKGESPLDLAIQNKNSIGALILLQEGAAKSFTKEERENLLIQSISTGNTCFFDSLIDFFDLDINEFLIKDQPFIFYVASILPSHLLGNIYNSPNLNFNRYNLQGQTLIHHAVETDDINLINILMSSNSRISFNMLDQSGRTPLELLLMKFDPFNKVHNELLNLLSSHPSVTIRQSMMDLEMWQVLANYHPSYYEKNKCSKGLLIFTNAQDSEQFYETNILQLSR